MARRKLKTIHEYTCKLCGDVFQDGDLALAHLVQRHPNEAAKKTKLHKLNTCLECGSSKIETADDVLSRKRFRYCGTCRAFLGYTEGGGAR